MEQVTPKNKDVINLLCIAVSSYLAVCCYNDLTKEGKGSLLKHDVKRKTLIASNAMGGVVDTLTKELDFIGADWQNEVIQEYIDVFQIMVLGGEEKRKSIMNHIKAIL